VALRRVTQSILSWSTQGRKAEQNGRVQQVLVS
jgi:hypothetical protein